MANSDYSAGQMRNGECGMRTGLSLLALMAIVLPVCGCNNSRFREAQEVRNDRMYDLVQRVPPRQEQGLDNIHELGVLHDNLEVHRAETLQGTVDFVEGRERQRAEDWREGKMRRRWRDLFFGGHTDQIDDTFAKMFY